MIQRNTHDRTVASLTSQTLVAAGKKRPISTYNSTFNRTEFGNGKPTETGPRNPKIQALLDEIINDNGQDMDVTSLHSFAVKQNTSPAILRAIPQNTYTFPSKKSILPPNPSAEVIAEVFLEKELPTPLVVDVFPQAVDSK